MLRQETVSFQTANRWRKGWANILKNYPNSGFSTKEKGGVGRASSKGRKGIADLLEHHPLLKGKHHLFPLTQKSWITELWQKFKLLAVTFMLPLISVYMKAF